MAKKVKLDRTQKITAHSAERPRFASNEVLGSFAATGAGPIIASDVDGVLWRINPQDGTASKVDFK